MYFMRKIRTGEEKNSEIKSFSIYCENAKKEGKQYTKRMLPFFVTPECNIMLIAVLKYIQLYPDGTINYDQASIILGTFDNRTIQKHIILGWMMIRMTISEQLTIIADFPGFSSIQLKKPDENLWEYLVKVTKEIREGNIRMGNIIPGSESECETHLHVHILLIYHKARNALKAPLNHVLKRVPYYDTS